MISFIIPARNSADLTYNCLDSLYESLKSLPLSCVEIILINDDSPEKEIDEIFLSFKHDVSEFETFVYRFFERQHYTRVLGFGLSQARGHLIFFISNDMVITPTFIKNLILVSQCERNIGIVRGTSQHCDSLRQHEIYPPLTLENYAQICAFSDYINQYNGLIYEEDTILSGDAILIKRELVDKIGYIDTQFFSYFGDLDYGIRLRKAGFKMVCAKGAWLFHHGAGYIKAEAPSEDFSPEKMNQRQKMVNETYRLFCRKYNLPQGDFYGHNMRGLDQICNELVMQESLDIPLFVPPYLPNKDIYIEIE